jgi:hypothetical protein
VEEVKIKHNRKRLLYVVAAAIPFILFGIQICLKGIETDNQIYMTAGFLMSVFWIGILLLILYKFFTQPYAILLSKNGFLDTTSPLQFGMVRWSDIKNITLDKNDSTKIVFYLNSNKKWKQKLVNENQRKLYASNKTTYGSPMVVDNKNLNEKVEDVLAKIKEFPTKVIDIKSI